MNLSVILLSWFDASWYYHQQKPVQVWSILLLHEPSRAELNSVYALKCVLSTKHKSSILTETYQNCFLFLLPYMLTRMCQFFIVCLSKNKMFRAEVSKVKQKKTIKLLVTMKQNDQNVKKRGTKKSSKITHTQTSIQLYSRTSVVYQYV